MGTKPPVNRSTATKLTRAAQATAALLACGAGAIFAWDAAGNEPQDSAAMGPAEPVVVDIPEPDTTPLIPDVRNVDFTGLVERISQVDNAPDLPVPEEEVDTGTAEVETIVESGDPTISDRVAYLGHISVGDSMMALLKVDGKQRTARPGAVIPGSTGEGKSALELVRVRNGSVSVRAAGSSESSTLIERADGGGASPSTTTIAARPPSGQVAGDGVRSPEERIARAREREGNRANGSVLEPDPLKRRLESIQRLYDQGRIDEERYKTMIQRAEEQLQRAQEAREQRQDD